MTEQFENSSTIKRIVKQKGEMDIMKISSRDEFNKQITTGAGDIILYQGNSLVIYYDTNSWNFTRIGKIDGVTREELLDAFGNGGVTVTFSLE